MAVVIQNEVAFRIMDLARKNQKTFTEQLIIMAEAFEVMNIQKIYYLPVPTGGHPVPVVEVNEPVSRRAGTAGMDTHPT